VNSDQPGVKYQPGSDLFSAIVVRLVTLESSQRVTEHPDGTTVHEPGYVVAPIACEAAVHETPTWYPRTLLDHRSLKVGHLNVLNRQAGRGLNSDSVTPNMVRTIIASRKAARIDEKTTLLSVTLTNGFVIHETASCVDPRRYDQVIGEEICMQNIEKKIWELLGFLLQTARFGFAHVAKPDPDEWNVTMQAVAQANGCTEEPCGSVEASKTYRSE